MENRKLLLSMMVLFGFLGFSLIAVSSDVIRLKPGSNIDVKPNTTTTVICEGTPADQAVSYCKCRWENLNPENSLLKKGYVLYRVTVIDKQKVEDVVSIYENEKQACESAMVSHPACKR